MNPANARRAVPLLLALAVVWAYLAPEAGRAAPVGSSQVDTVHTAGTALERVSLDFAGALASGSGSRLSVVLASGGIRLHLDEQGHAGLSSRQAVASLREFLRGYEGGQAVVMRVALIEGSSDRGFAEVLWTGRVSGTSQGIRRTLFVGLIRAGGDWRVDEVRFLR